MLLINIFLFVCLLVELILYFYSIYCYKQFLSSGAYSTLVSIPVEASDKQKILADLDAKCAFSEIAIQVLQQKNAQLIAEHQEKVQDYLAEANLLSTSIAQVENLLWEKNQQIRCKAMVLQSIAAQLVDWNDSFEDVFRSHVPTLRLGRDHNRLVKQIIVQTVNAGIRASSDKVNDFNNIPEAFQHAIPKLKPQFEQVNAIAIPPTENNNPTAFQNIQLNGAQLVNAIQSIIADLEQHRKLQRLSHSSS